MQTGLANRVVVVTGGSSGIGRAAALAFGREGAWVAITYHTDQAAAAGCAAEIEAAGSAASAFRFELGAPSRDGAAELVRQVSDRWGGVDVLVNCAGGRDRSAPWGGRFEDGQPEQWRAMLDSDLAGPYALLQAAVPAMRGRGWGRIGLTLTDRVRRNSPAQVREAIAGRVPSRRLSGPADVAELIVFLASDANRNISGEIVREGSATGRSAHAG